jgi:hypothetical protein
MRTYNKPRTRMTLKDKPADVSLEVWETDCNQ